MKHDKQTPPLKERTKVLPVQLVEVSTQTVPGFLLMETPNYQLSLNLGKDLQNTVPSKTEPIEREHCSPQIPSKNMSLFVHSSNKPLEKEECCWGCRGCRNPPLARASHPGPSNAHGQGHGEQPVQEAPLEVGNRDS